MKNVLELSEIKGEMLLHYLYPELDDKWIVSNKGTFYRNYNNDILFLDDKNALVHFSRDNFTKLLPPGLFTKDDGLKGKEFKKKYKRQRDEQQLLQEFFAPIDSLFFKQRLGIERKVSELLEEKLSFILKSYFNFDYNREQNRYIKELAPFLLHVKKIRGDFNFIRDVLSALLKCKVEMEVGRYMQSDRIECALPHVRYLLFIPSLSNNEFNELNEICTPFFNFIKEWFIPFDVQCNFNIKEQNKELLLDGSFTLDYNTELHLKNLSI